VHLSILLLKKQLNDLTHWLAYFNILVEQLRFCVVARLNVVEDMSEKDDLELVEMKGFGYVQYELVRVLVCMIFGCFVQDLVRFISKAIAVELPV